MNENLKFYKGFEPYLPSGEDIVNGALYHCEDTGNTYRGTDNHTLELYSSAIGRRDFDWHDPDVKGMIFGINNKAYAHTAEAHGYNTVATSEGQFVIGHDNKINENALLIVGEGEEGTPHNVFEIDDKGIKYNEEIYLSPFIMYGSIYLGDENQVSINQIHSINDHDHYTLPEALNYYFSMGEPALHQSSYMELSDANWGGPNPIRLYLSDYNNSEDYEQRFYKFTGVAHNVLISVTWQWVDGEWRFDLTQNSISAQYVILTEGSLGNFYGVCDLYDGARINITFDNPLKKTKFYSINDYPVYYQGLSNFSVPHEFFKGSYDLIYSARENCFTLVGSIYKNASSVKASYTNNSNTESYPEFNTPILLGNNKGNDWSNEDKRKNFYTAIVNRDNPILADLHTGAINAPGGLQVFCEDSHEGGEEQTINYNGDGIYINQDERYGPFAKYTFSPYGAGAYLDNGNTFHVYGDDRGVAASCVFSNSRLQYYNLTKTTDRNGDFALATGWIFTDTNNSSNNMHWSFELVPDGYNEGGLCMLRNRANQDACVIFDARGGATFESAVTAPGFNGNASSASKLNTNAGSATQPIYFSKGIPVACDSTLNVDISGRAAVATSITETATTSNKTYPILLGTSGLGSTSTTGSVNFDTGFVFNPSSNAIHGLAEIHNDTNTAYKLKLYAGNSIEFYIQDTKVGSFTADSETLTKALTVPNLIIDNTDIAQGLEFKRSGYNYIQAPTNSKIAFCCNSTLALDNASVIINANSLILKSKKGYGTADERDKISGPEVGQLFFVLAE